ncbi:HTH-type transcriptional regulator NmtR [Corynebacterium capitovis DSM 44611]|uniref:ArsR/SmtB family transcription factor n=1 Tax=Corynebacterium capitovis TaxID=131081 RepID=UPI0003767763|nr:metalloregulator ArsR/SmtB family transcription factor [Corynebacterium capitovis]WKD58398.1 HTH-type transcriptional regulator NmtR [Corynebacterium capitovis DSM 44611]
MRAQSLLDAPSCCSLNTGPLTDTDADHYAALFKVLAQPVRLQILSHLAAGGCGPVTVNELTDKLGLSQPTVSHHLKKLTEAGLLTREQRGRSVVHTVRVEPFAELRGILEIG